MNKINHIDILGNRLVPQRALESWYVLAIEPGWEMRLTTALTGDGLPAYAPREEVQRFRRGRSVVREMPFLGGYLFVQADLSRIGISTIEGQRGAIALVRGASRLPSPVPASAIDSLRALEDPDGLIRATRALRHRFEIGAEVRVTEGVWGGLIGRVLATRGYERVRLLLEQMKDGAPEMRLEMPVSMLERVA